MSILPDNSPLAKLTPDQQRLVTDNLGLAHEYAWIFTQRFFRKSPDRYKRQIQEELASYGIWALCRSAANYCSGHESKAKFSTYAWQAIRNQIKCYGIPECEMMIGSVESKRQCRGARVLTMTFREHPRGSTRCIEVPDEHALEPIDEISDRDKPTLVSNELKCLMWLVLTGRETDMVLAYAVEGRTLQDIADEAGLTKQRVLQLIQRAYRDLRDCPAFVDALWAQAERAKRLSRHDFQRTAWKVA